MIASQEFMDKLEAMFYEALRNGYQQALDDVVQLLDQLRANNERYREQHAQHEPEPDVVQLPDVPTKVCKDCGRELPATEEFFRIHGRSGKPMQPCRECFHKSRQQPLTCSSKRPKFGTSLAERYPKCPRADCHMRKSCGLIDKPTECESFMKLHEGDE